MSTYYLRTLRTQPRQSPAPDLLVSFGSPLQTMDGFGASDQFLDDTPLSDAYADLFFDSTLGIGLSFLRIGINSDGSIMSFYANATKAAARGAKIVMTPRTAAAAQKDNGSETNGGHLLAGSYGAWSDTITSAASGFSANTGGVNLYAISVQDEPDFSSSSTSMLYTNAEMTAFVKVLGPKLAALSPAPLLITPEVATQANMDGYVSNTMADSTAAALVGFLAWHQYGGVWTPSNSSRRNWMMEMSYFSAFDATMTNALLMASDIHGALTTGNASAWFWWWILRTSQTDNEGLTDTVTPTKRLYALGNWSKFVRPGWSRVSTTGSLGGLSVTAFRSVAGAFAVVAINATAAAVTATMGFAGLTVSSVIPWLTDASNNLVAQSSVPVSGQRFSATVAANSVTTFVGTGS